MALDNGWIVYVKSFEPYNVTKASPYHGSDDPRGPLFEAVAWRLADALGGPVAQVVQPGQVRNPGATARELHGRRPGQCAAVALTA